jgi:hypothetical protein
MESKKSNESRQFYLKTNIQHNHNDSHVQAEGSVI